MDILLGIAIGCMLEINSHICNDKKKNEQEKLVNKLGWQQGGM